MLSIFKLEHLACYAMLCYAQEAAVPTLELSWRLVTSDQSRGECCDKDKIRICEA